MAESQQTSFLKKKKDVHAFKKGYDYAKLCGLKSNSLYMRKRIFMCTYTASFVGEERRKLIRGSEEAVDRSNV